MRKALSILLFLGALSFVVQVPAQAQAQYDIKTMTPEVEKALENRRARYNDLKAFKENGTIGENNKGYVEALKDDPQAQQLADAENADRKVIYQTIADQNGLSGSIDVIETTFAKVQRDKAASGEMVQDPDGERVKK